MIGQCLSDKLVYHASVASDDKTEHYIGLSENTFKQRQFWNNHSFQNEAAPQTTLSNYIWDLKRNIGGGYKKQLQTLQTMSYREIFNNE